MSKVGVWITVRTEEKHLRGALESVLSQSMNDLTLYVSNNWSTDGSLQIIDRFAKEDSRVVIWHPPEFLAGIPHMKWVWSKLTAETNHTYTIHLGGHDWWPEGHLELMVARMDQDLVLMQSARPVPIEVALLYSDTMQVNQQREVVGRFMDITQLGQTPKAMVPHVAITTMNSPQFFGLWNERVRKKIKVRYPTGGWDHLIVAEAALHGQILFEGRTALRMLGPDPDPTGLEGYGKKHFSKERLAAGIADFVDQLRWYSELVRESLDYCPPEAQPIHYALGITSVISLYLALRGQNLLAVPGAMDTFNNNEHVKMILGGAQHIGKHFEMLLESVPLIND